MVSFRKSTGDAVETVRASAWTLVAGKTYDRILTWVGDATVVLLGEATHGSHDFQAARAALTRRLIEERGFAAVAIEADASDAFQVNRYAQGLSGREPTDLLNGFVEFPSWVWRNTAVTEFAAWLHEFNTSKPEAKKVGFHGLDLYGLHASMRSAVDYLQSVDPAAAVMAREHCADFDHFGDAEPYLWAPSGPTGADAVARHLAASWAQREQALRGGAETNAGGSFGAETKTGVARDAERYYRLVLPGRRDAWNLRTRHMAETLQDLRAQLSACRRQPKIVVWAHNTHVGDARATDRREQGEISLGQLARERYGDEVRLVGCTAYAGHVVSASSWGGPAEVKRIEPALAGSFEEIFHRVGLPRFFLPFSSGPDVRDLLGESRLERAIGLVYRPEQERWSHYFNAELADQFDAILHVDESHPLEPLERLSEWDPNELPAMHPTGA